MIRIGLTGGIGSGKSTVAQLLVAKGAVLIDADAIVRELQAPGQPVFNAMVEHFGDGIVAEDGTLNRQAVADIVFHDADQLKALNDLVHPAVGEVVIEQIAAAEKDGSVVIQDIPLLAESGRRDFAGIVVVDTPPEIAADRLVEHRGFSREDAEARIANQASRDERLALADQVIDNSGTLDAVGPQVDAVWDWIEELVANPPEPDSTGDEVVADTGDQTDTDAKP